MSGWSTLSLCGALGVQSTPHSAPVTQWGPRLAFTFLTLLIIALAVVGMRRGWKGKAKKFAELVAPESALPTDAHLLCGPLEARFAGTTTHGNWLDRVTVFDLGTPRGVAVSLYQEGLWLTDSDTFSLWIPKSAITKITTSRGLAGDVVEPDGMIIIEWALAQTAESQVMALDSGIRIARHDDHNNFLNHIAHVVPHVAHDLAHITEEQA